MRLLPLLSHSPDLNPIERAFSVIKAWLQTNGDYNLGETIGRNFDGPSLLREGVSGLVTAETVGIAMAGIPYTM
jgi:hypothetical protein